MARDSIDREVRRWEWVIERQFPGELPGLTVASGQGPMTLWREILKVPGSLSQLTASLRSFARRNASMNAHPLYVASSWKNSLYDDVRDNLEGEGYGICDWREVDPFSWSDVDLNWEAWGAAEYANAMSEMKVQRAAAKDLRLMYEAAACVLLLPCGRSAHLEAGWFVGQGKPLFILLEGETVVPELMYHLATGIAQNQTELIKMLRAHMPTVKHLKRR